MPNANEDLYGSWRALSGVLGGTDMPEDLVSATRLTIRPDEYAVDLAGTIDSGSCRIDMETSPIRIQIDGQRGPNAGKTFLAIVEFLETDQIRIAYDLSGTAFPDSFQPTSEASSYVATFQKCKSGD